MAPHIQTEPPFRHVHDMGAHALQVKSVAGLPHIYARPHPNVNLTRPACVNQDPCTRTCMHAYIYIYYIYIHGLSYMR